MASLLLGTSVMSCHQVHANPSSLSFTNSVSGGGVSLSLAPTTSSLSTSATSPCPPLIYCGRGDKKTAKGKRFNHSFGNARPRNKKKGRGPPKPPYPPPAPKYEAPAAEELLSTETGEE